MSIMTRAMRAQEVALCVVRKWWRPATCIGIAGGALVNLVIIPLKTWTVPDMAAAAAAAFAVREWGKAKGTAE